VNSATFSSPLKISKFGFPEDSPGRTKPPTNQQAHNATSHQWSKPRNSELHRTTTEHLPFYSPLQDLVMGKSLLHLTYLNARQERLAVPTYRFWKP